MAVERVTLTWSLENWVTIFLMWALAFFVVTAFIATGRKYMSGPQTVPQSTEGTS